MKKTLLSLLIVSALVLAACGTDVEGDGPLIVYSGRSEDLIGPLIAEFETSTGIDVEVRYGDSAELAATLLAEGDATDADVFFAQDPASLGAVAGLLSRLPSDVTQLVAERFRDPQSRWVGTSARVRVLVYNTQQIAADALPASIDDLLELDARIGVAPTNGSFLAFVAAMILERGEGATLEWLRSLDGRDPLDYPKNSAIVAAVDAGEIQAGLVNHYYLLRLQAEGAGLNAANHFFSAGDAGSLVMPAGAGILSNSDQPATAARFIEFLLSDQAQTYFSEVTFEYPMVEGIAPAPGLPALDSLAPPDIDLSRLAEVLDRATDLVTEAGLL